MKITLCQINPTIGDFARNSKRILNFLKQEPCEDADLIIFPECSLMGYHPVDLLERPSVVKVELESLKTFSKQIPRGKLVLIGAILPNPSSRGKPFQNCAVLLKRGRILRTFAKELLPTYDVFDEARHIEPGRVQDNLYKIKDKRILFTICEDIWAWPLPKQKAIYDHNPLLGISRKKVDLVVNLSASPFTKLKYENRKHVIGATAKRFGAPLIYCNLVGAQDELIFDGRSIVANEQGKVVAQLKAFEEDILAVEVDDLPKLAKFTPLPKTEALSRAIILGIQDFVHKIGLGRAHLGLSGGIDSAVVLELLVRALGKTNVAALAMPGPFSSPDSLAWAQEQAKNLGVSFFEIPILAPYQVLISELKTAWGEKSFSVMEENLQARLRGMILMAYSNREQSLLMNTSNKSEFAVGYSTLYGDMCGALCPIGDLLKTEVYEIAQHLNSTGGRIPANVIDRPPSAELRPDQRDTDSLPPYAELDPIVAGLVENYAPTRSPAEQKILSMLMKSEFKRWQAPPILKLSEHSFGRGRRLPLAHKGIF